LQKDQSQFCDFLFFSRSFPRAVFNRFRRFSRDYIAPLTFLPSSSSSLARFLCLFHFFSFVHQHFALASVSRKWRQRMHIVVVQSRLRGTYFQPLSWVVRIGDSPSFSLRDDVIAEITGKFSSSDDKRKVLRFTSRLSRFS